MVYLTSKQNVRYFVEHIHPARKWHDPWNLNTFVIPHVKSLPYSQLVIMTLHFERSFIIHVSNKDMSSTWSLLMS